MKNNILIAGCGQLGSRHLQALKSIDQDIEIYVYDPNQESLDMAYERFESVEGNNHKTIYSREISVGTDFKVAIVATTSNVRKKVIDEILKKNKVEYFLLEKILFNKKEDYYYIANLFNDQKSKAWVNCSMRTMPFYESIKKRFSEGIINYHVSGSNYGLITNSIHYIDHIAYLNNCTDFSVITDGLDVNMINSKRNGFAELNGTISVIFKNGAFGSISCYSEGELPVIVEIDHKELRCISREAEGKAWVSAIENSWNWEELDAQIPYQSQMTRWLVEDLLEKGHCNLPEYSESMKIHLTLFEAIQDFLKQKKLVINEFYPFT